MNPDTDSSTTLDVKRESSDLSQSTSCTSRSRGVTVLPLTFDVAHASVAADVLARAFQNDPGTIYFFPDPVRRAAMLSSMFEVMIRYGLKHGSVCLDQSPPRGVGIWLPPGKTSPDEAGLAEAGVADVASLWGTDAMGRLGSLVAFLEELHGRLVTEPHWRLYFLGVGPEHQGNGVGSALVEARPSQPSDGTPTYLETLTMTNVFFYKRHGYNVLAEAVMPRTDLHIWAMLRCPR